MNEMMAAAIPPEEPRRDFRALMRNRNYALLWTGQFVSEMGNRFHWIAVSLWIYSLTESAAAVSLAISSMFAGGLIVSLWAGVIVDHFDRRKILVTTDLVRALLVAAIPLLIRSSIWFVYADLVLISTATAFSRPAMFAVIPATVPRPSLLAANSLFSAMDTGTEMAGPVLAGLLAQTLGYSPLLYIDALTYVFSGLCVMLMTLPASVERGRWGLSFGSIYQGVAEALQYIRRDSLQRGLFILIIPATLVGSGLNALQTPLAKGSVGLTDTQFGTFNSVWGVGFLVASIVLGWYGSVLRRGMLILAGYFLSFATTALMGLSQSFQHLLLTAFALGFANTMYYVGLGTVLMEYTPSTFMGRVISTRQVAIGFVRVVSPLAFGALAERTGIRTSILVMAMIGALGTSAVVAGSPPVRQLGRSKDAGGRASRIWNSTVGSVDPDIEKNRQYRMNAVSLVLALSVFAFLVFRLGDNALTLAILIVAFAYLGSLAKKKLGAR